VGRFVDIVKDAWLRLFGSWRGFFEYVIFLGVSVAGVANASWLWPVVGAMALLLIGWERYSELFAKAGKVDAGYRELAQLAHSHGHVGLGFALYLRARTLAIVLGAKLGHDALFLIGAFICGHVARWLWFG
jgi:hypothetical protein